MKIVAVIQARMSSTRMPGKVLKTLAGKPLLWHIVKRLERSRHLNAIVLAISTDRSDDPLADYAQALGIAVVRGPLDNVLARFVMAARQHKADIVLRVCGDSPLVDPVTVDNLIEKLLAEGSDRAIADPRQSCIHEGFSPFTVRWLYRLEEQAGDNPVAREHVCGYVDLHPDFAATSVITLPKIQQLDGFRISVDVPADLQFLESLYKELGAGPGEIEVDQVCELLRQEPKLGEINAHVSRKSASQQSYRVLFRCNANPQVGMGHLIRCLALGQALRDGAGMGVEFAMYDSATARPRLAEQSFVCTPLTTEQGPELRRLLEEHRIDLLVTDLRPSMDRGIVASIRGSGIPVVAIDEAGNARLEADLVFYPPGDDVSLWSWEGAKGKYFQGWEWVILRPDFTVEDRTGQALHEPPRILISLGGSDPDNDVLKVVQSLARVPSSLVAVFVLGPDYAHEEDLRRQLKANFPHAYEILRNVLDMARPMRGADLAIVAFGVTSFELAAVGTPALYIGTTPDHDQTANIFANAGIGVYLGQASHLDPTKLADQVQYLLQNPALRAAMSRAGIGHVDVDGSKRIAEQICRLLEEKSHTHCRNAGNGTTA